jgi:hypothetical protein
MSTPRPFSYGKASIEESDTVLNQTPTRLVIFTTDTLMVGRALFSVQLHDELWTLAHDDELTKNPNHAVLRKRSFLVLRKSTLSKQLRIIGRASTVRCDIYRAEGQIHLPIPEMVASMRGAIKAAKKHTEEINVHLPELTCPLAYFGENGWYMKPRER